MKVMVTLAKDEMLFGSFATSWKFEKVVVGFPLIHELTEESIKAIEAYFDDFVVAVLKLDEQEV